MKVAVYTDGACTHNGKPGAKASWAYYFPEHPGSSEADRVPSDQPQTNNRGELLAILRAIEKVIQTFSATEVDLYIYTDSEYSRNCLTSWVPGWIKKGWITASGTPVLNKDLIQLISGQLLKFNSYCITHVKAHTGGDDEFSKNNAIVDRMAVNVINPTEPAVVPIKGIDGCPLQMMGPPVSETALVAWCRAHLDLLDKEALDSALVSALNKTYAKNGCTIKKQKLHRTSQYRLIASTHITTEVVKEE